MNAALELLAPAKDKDCAICAINYGADAVYMGAPFFGARKNASNTLVDIKQVVDYAHKFFVKVYVTLNTILSNDELKKVQKLLYDLYEIGVDGIIVQDFAIFNLDLPPFLISASTQCDIRNIEKVKFFENIGLNRVILARELSLNEIRNICLNTNIEVETFVHGALCVSYSGQCYLSYGLGNRSSNRGECAQPCRRKYTLVNNYGKIYAKNKYLLSLKDFCAAKYLDDLINAGVVSFKIEGRLKDESYVKNVCTFYNTLLQKYKRTSSGKAFYDFQPELNKTFNRGFTDYFLDGNGEDIYNFDTPKHLGEKIGVVKKNGKNFIEIQYCAKINAQDGLCYFFDDDLKGFLINKVEYESNIARVFPNSIPKIKAGTVVYRNFDFEFDKQLKNSKTRRQIGVNLYVYKDKIKVIDEDNIEYVADINFDEFANNYEKMKTVYERNLKKTGESYFYVKHIYFEDVKIAFLKISQINALRRVLFDGLLELRVKLYEKNRINRKINKIIPANFPQTNNDYRLNVHNKVAEDFYKDCNFAPKQYSYETKRVKNAELMRTKHCLRRAFGICCKVSKNDNEVLFLIDEKNKKLKLEFDCKNCEMIVKEP